MNKDEYISKTKELLKVLEYDKLFKEWMPDKPLQYWGCPFCGHKRSEGHRIDCKLKKLLEEEVD